MSAKSFIQKDAQKKVRYGIVVFSVPLVERPRDATHLSLVSFNSTIHRAQSFVISQAYLGVRFTNAYN